MKIKIRIFPFLVLLYAFGVASCDCVQRKEGIIIDKQTKESIEGVEIYKESRPTQKSFSNSCGYYEWSGISGGLSPKCPEPKLYFIHPAYDTLFNPENTNVVRLTKRKK